MITTGRVPRWSALAVAGALAMAAPTLRGAADTSRTVYLSAVDLKGEILTDLKASDLIVKENGQARDVVELAPAVALLHVAILVDDGGQGSMQRPVAEILNGAAGRAAFSISMLNPQSIVLNDFSVDADVLQRSVGRLVQRGRVERDPRVLGDAVAWAAKDLLTRRLTRPVIVVLTNGQEENEREIATAILADLRSSGASLHVVHVVATDLSAVLVDGPTQSGGSSTVATNTDGFARAMAAVARTLTHQYRLTYRLPDGAKPGERLEVRSTRKGVQVVAPTRIPNRVP